MSRRNSRFLNMLMATSLLLGTTAGGAFAADESKIAAGVERSALGGFDFTIVPRLNEETAPVPAAQQPEVRAQAETTAVSDGIAAGATTAKEGNAADAAEATPVKGGVATEVTVAKESAPTEATVAVLSSTTAAPTLPSEIIYIDNDDAKAAAIVEETFKWEEIPDQPGKTKISTGAVFPVRVVSEHNSKTTKVGDPVEAQLRLDLKIGGRLVAPKGTRVMGHVKTCMPARRILAAELSRKRWFRANGEIGIQFDEIITADGEHLLLEATPARASRIVENKNEGRVMGVNKNGEVASPLSIQLKHQALHLAIRGAASMGGVFSMGAVPVAYATIGAINPSFAFLQPVGKNVPHRRLKGAAMGFVSGVPGGFLIADTIIKGAEARIKPGDEFLIEFKQDFTGEPATEAEMQSASRNVHGEVVKQNKPSKKKK